MVNGRILECELKKIDEFFDALSVEEFENNEKYAGEEVDIDFNIYS